MATFCIATAALATLRVGACRFRLPISLADLYTKAPACRAPIYNWTGFHYRRRRLPTTNASFVRRQGGFAPAARSATSWQAASHVRVSARSRTCRRAITNGSASIDRSASAVSTRKDARSAALRCVTGRVGYAVDQLAVLRHRRLRLGRHQASYRHRWRGLTSSESHVTPAGLLAQAVEVHVRTELVVRRSSTCIADWSASS